MFFYVFSFAQPEDCLSVTPLQRKEKELNDFLSPWLWVSSRKLDRPENTSSNRSPSSAGSAVLENSRK